MADWLGAGLQTLLGWFDSNIALKNNLDTLDIVLIFRYNKLQAQVVELVYTAALEPVYWEFESLLEYKSRTWLQDMSSLSGQKDRSAGRLQ